MTIAGMDAMDHFTMKETIDQKGMLTSETTTLVGRESDILFSC